MAESDLWREAMRYKWGESSPYRLPQVPSFLPGLTMHLVPSGQSAGPVQQDFLPSHLPPLQVRHAPLQCFALAHSAQVPLRQYSP